MNVISDKQSTIYLHKENNKSEEYEVAVLCSQYSHWHNSRSLCNSSVTCTVTAERNESIGETFGKNITLSVSHDSRPLVVYHVSWRTIIQMSL